MRAVVQRVKQASVSVEEKVTGAIGAGVVVLLGVGKDDSSKNVEYLANKILSLRIFPSPAAADNPRKNISLLEIQGEILVISQFTLYGDCRKGRRPSYDKAGPPKLAEKFYLEFIEVCRDAGLKTAAGVFGAMMDVSLVNWGPVTLIIDS